MIVLLLKLIGLCSMIVLAWKIAISEDMLLEDIGSYLEYKANEEGSKWAMMFFCPFCLPTLTSLIAFAFAFALNIIPFEFNWRYFVLWPLVIFGSSIVSGFTWTLYETVNQVKEKNESEKEYFDRCNAIDEESQESNRVFDPYSYLDN